MSLSDDAYVAIKRLIVTCELAPETAIDEAAMQERLGIGRTPIREAIQHLERDQFVRVEPRRGVFVTPIDTSELSLLFETRSLIEPYAARLATERGAAALWDEMAVALAMASGVSDPKEMLAIDRRCHELLWQGAANRFLTDTLDNLYAQSERVWFYYVRDVVDLHDVLGEHIEMLGALRNGDATSVAKIMETHVRSFQEEILSVVR